jgi:hypothetical protein
MRITKFFLTDEWNERGLGRMAGKRSNRLNHSAEFDSILDRIVQAKKEDRDEAVEDKPVEKLSLRKALLAGIMTAIKESTLNDFYGSKYSASLHITC